MILRFGTSGEIKILVSGLLDVHSHNHDNECQWMGLNYFKASTVAKTLRVTLQITH